MDGCLDDEVLAAYLDGTLAPHEIARIDSHVDVCASCRGDLSALVLAHGSVSQPLPEPAEGPGLALAPGDRIGRYVVLHELARGGMGVVAVAEDPELAREVAIKVLHAPTSGEALRDEARAMARLDHPNVVAVHDVGKQDGRLFLTMELVDGVSLRAWLAADRRGWRAVVGACLAAGRGLAAAHRAGLVHRDFKPENVLCGPADRVRVTDFGLAHHDGPRLRGPQGSGLAGTPRYLAPELWRGAPATARSDQWSFCVTLYEALAGRPPFEGKDLAELAAAVQRAQPAPLVGVPKRVARAISRGLARDPAGRWESLDELLAELERALRGPVRSGVAVAAAALALGAIGFAATRGAEPVLCELPESLLAGTWDSTTQRSLEAAFAGTAHGVDTARRVTTILDDYATAWLDARREACTATRVRGDQTEAVLDARLRCLDRRHAELGALVRGLADRPTPAMIDGAVRAARDLPPIESCGPLAVRAEQPAPADPIRAAMVTELERELGEVHGARLAGRLAGLEARARALVDRARTLRHPPLVARALEQVAQLAIYATDREATDRTLREALDAAAAAKDDRLVASLWVELVSFTAMQRGDATLALAHARAAEVAVLRADSTPQLRGAFFHARGMALAMQGSFPEARASFERALADAPTRLQRATTQSALCNVELRLGRLAEAAARCAEAVAGLEAELGPHHPNVAFTVLNAGTIAMQQHDFARAKAELERAVALLAAAVGERHVAYALALNNLAMVKERTGELDPAYRDYTRARELLDALAHPDAFSPRLNLGNIARQRGHTDEARRHWQEALVIAERTHGKASDRAAQIWHSLGALEIDLGHLDLAEQAYTKMRTISEGLFGERHPNVARALDGLGFVHAGRGDHRRALELRRRALAIDEATLGPEHPHVAETLTTVGASQSTLGDRAAIATLERAVAIFAKHDDGPTYPPAAARWTLAQALVRLGGDRARAVTLAREARALYASSPEKAAADVLPVIDRWLARHAR